MLKYALIIVAAISSGIALGREQLAGHIEKQKNASISVTADKVRRELKNSTRHYLTEAISYFYKNLILKASVLLCLWGAHRLDWFGDKLTVVLLSLAMAIFLAWDVWRIFPRTRFILAELRQHGWKPRFALGEVVAAHVFERVLAEAQATTGDLPQSRRLLLRLAGNSPDRLTQEIAAEVSDIARTTSWNDLKPYLLVAAVSASCMTILYSGFLWVIWQV